MGDRAFVGHAGVALEPCDEVVHRGLRLEIGGAVLPGPAFDLAGYVVGGAAVIGQADGGGVDGVEMGEGSGHVREGRAAMVRTDTGHGAVGVDAAGSVIHDEEGGADDGGVVAEEAHAGNRDVGWAEGLHDAIFALDGVGGGEKGATRLLAQDVGGGGGLQVEGRVGLAPLELSDFDSGFDPWKLSDEVALERRLVEAMVGQDRDEFGPTRFEPRLRAPFRHGCGQGGIWRVPGGRAGADGPRRGRRRCGACGHTYTYNRGRNRC